MQTSENNHPDRLLGAIGHMAEASDLAYQLVQRLAFMVHELAPLTGGPLEPRTAADRAYAHALVASGAAHRITRDIAAIATAFDAELELDERPDLSVVGS